MSIFTKIYENNKVYVSWLFESWKIWSAKKNIDEWLKLKIPVQESFKIFKNWIQLFKQEGKNLYKWSRKDTEWKVIPPRLLSEDEKKYFGYDLNSIDLNKVSSITREELGFIFDIMCFTWNSIIKNDERLSLNIWWINFKKKHKIVRNKNIWYESKLIKELSDNMGWDKTNNTRALRRKQKTLKTEFKKWIINEMRSKWLHIPEMSSWESNKEMDIEITKTIFKNI